VGALKRLSLSEAAVAAFAALLRVTQDSAAREVLGPDQARQIDDTLERIARAGELLDHLDKSARRLMKRIKKQTEENSADRTPH
jgi:hypothetical protein